MFKKEEIPNYFDNIIFQNKLALVASIYYIADFDINLNVKRIKGIDNSSLMEIITNNRISKKNRQDLIRFGKLLDSIVTYCNLDKKKTYIEYLPRVVSILSQTKEGKPADIVFNYKNEFKFVTDSITKMYEKHAGFYTGDCTDYRTYYDKNNDFTLVEVGFIKKEKINDDKECIFENKKVNSVCRKFSYNLSNKNYSLKTIVDSDVLMDEGGLFSHIKNLRLPVDVCKFLKTITEGYILNRSSNISIYQEKDNEVLDSIEIRDKGLNYCKITDEIDNSVLSIDNQGSLDYIVTNNGEDGTCLKYRVTKKVSEPVEFNVEARGSEMMNRIENGTDIREQVYYTYEKTLQKLPSWAKRN